MPKTGQISTAKRNRNAVACRRCHEQRIRCDGTTAGIPCTNCRRAKHHNCQFFESKRLRGENGRFMTPSRNHQDSLSANTTGSSASSLTTTVQSPEYTLDLENLCRVDEQSTEANTSSELPTPGMWSAINSGTSQSSPNQALRSAQTVTWGESWYHSYIIHMMNDNLPISQQINGSNGMLSKYNEQSHRAEGFPSSNSAIKHHINSLPSPELTRSLVDAFFTHFHPFCPILQEHRIRSALYHNSLSVVLLRCIFFIASVHCDMNLLKSLGYNNRIDAEDDLFRKAKVAFNSDIERDNLTLLFCSYLLHYWSGRPTAFQDSLWWLAGTIRHAQSLGMHRRMGRKPATEQSRLWRKVWWLLYIRDRQVSFMLGKPAIINDNDCDVEELDDDDFRDECDMVRSYIIKQAHLSLAVSQILSLFSPCHVPKTMELSSVGNYLQFMEPLFLNWYNGLPPAMQATKPLKNQLGLILHMSFNCYKILCYRNLRQKRSRSLMTDEQPRYLDAILQAAGNITSLLEDAIIQFEARCFPMICISAVFAAMTVLYSHSRDPLADKSRREISSQQFRFNLLGLKEFEECHVLARWIRKLFIPLLGQSMSIDAPIPSLRSNAQNASFDQRTANQPIVGVPYPRSTIQESLHPSNPYSELCETVILGLPNGNQPIPDPHHEMPTYSEPSCFINPDMMSLGLAFPDLTSPFNLCINPHLPQEERPQTFVTMSACTEALDWPLQEVPGPYASDMWPISHE